MSDPAPAKQTDEFLDILTGLMRYRRRVISLLPEELAQERERLNRLGFSGNSWRNTDHDLFNRVGVVLSRRGEPVTMGELSKALDVPLSTATRIIDGLVENGYAERVPDPEDRRVVRVKLTPDGQELFRLLYSYIKQQADQILNRFSHEERDQLLVLLRKAVSFMDATTK